MTMSALSDELAQVRTKKKEFLAQIERIVRWKEWLTLIQPCYYKGERGNKPYPLETMLRLYLLQNLYDLSDEATAAEAIDSRAFSEFCGVDSSNQVPNGDTIGRFRNLLVKNGLQEKLFAQVVTALTEQGLILKKGTIVDSTIISAPSSTKNKEKKRDPDAHQVKKGNTWHFGYKAHVGVDKDSGLVHTVEATPANVHDVTQTSSLLTGEEDVVYGDSGYLGAGNREDAIVRNKSGRKIKYKINRRPSQLKKLSKSGQYAAKKVEHAKSSVRAKVETSAGISERSILPADVPVPHQAEPAHRPQLCPQAAPADIGTGRLQKGALSRSAPYLRHHVTGTRHGCEDTVRHHWPCLRQDHAEYLHPHYQRNAGKCRSQHRPRHRKGRNIPTESRSCIRGAEV